MYIHRSLAVAMLAALLSSTSTPAQTAPDERSRRDFMDAMAAVATRPTLDPAADARALREYALYPYLEAARLKRRLALATTAPATGTSLPIDDVIANFVARHDTEPVARSLRDAWLASLAARRLWPRFLEVFDPVRDTAPVLRCQSLAARIALGRTDGLVADLEPVWLAPRSLPDECDPAIAWWKARGGPGDDRVEQRARLALQAGEAALARHLARSLPAARAARIEQWAGLIEQPETGIRALIANPQRAIEPAALQDGWLRFARSDPDAAAAAYPRLVAARRLDERAASPLALGVALALSWSRHPGALAFYALVRPEDFDERAHEWQVRAALWAADWPRAAAAIAAMPEALRTQPRWRYWAARADERNGNFARAREGYAAVIPTDNWYALLASARLDRRYVPDLQPLGASIDGARALADDAGLLRARELLACGLETEASVEWRAALAAMPAQRQREAIGLAARWGWHHQAIASAARLRIFNDYVLLYPRPFDFDVAAASKRTGLAESLIYAIIRQESLYRAEAASAAGALGLMQLLPGTARIVARRAGRAPPARSELLQPATNVRLGTAYLADLVERFDGETALAAAAYNAGPNAARRWLPPAPLDLDVWVENIPFNETRAYVQRVNWHRVVFEWLDRRSPRDVADLLRSIKPT